MTEVRPDTGQAQQPHRRCFRDAWRRWLWQYGVAAGLAVLGKGLWVARVTVPEATIVIPRIWPRSIAFSKHGSCCYVADGNCPYVWRLGSYNSAQRFAGNGQFDYGGFDGNGRRATHAALSPWEITCDPEGQLCIVEGENNVVRLVNTAGVITTAVGCGSPGFSGDGGKASLAALNWPTGAVFDPEGNLFIADFGNRRIRRVDRAGVISTVAGNGRRGYSGDGGLATDARLNQPCDVAIDSKRNLYIADYGNHCIRRVNTSGAISTVAGKGTVALSPNSITLGGADELFVYDATEWVVYKVTARGSLVVVARRWGEYNGCKAVAEGPLPDQLSPYGVKSGAAGSIYIADGYYGVRKVDEAGIITTVVSGRGRFER